jgi:hypothetical protein
MSKRGAIKEIFFSLNSNKTDRHDITELLLKVALSTTITLILTPIGNMFQAYQTTTSTSLQNTVIE